MPRRCIACGCDLNLYENFLCLGCRADFPRTRTAGCARNPMADRFNLRIAERRDGAAGRYEYATALFYYRDGFKNITRTLKYGRNFSGGRHFARELGEELAASALFSDVDLVAPVPLHWTRRLSRGYNQAELIAKGVSGALGAEFCPELLKRTRRTSSQATLDPEMKYGNVRGAFSLRKTPPARTAHILLVDDVFTTGATLTECYVALRDILGDGPRISVATLAFAEG